MSAKTPPRASCRRIDGGLAQPVREAAHQVAGGLEQHHARIGQIQLRVILHHDQVDQFRQRAGNFNTGRAAAHNDEGQQRAPPAGVRFAAGQLEQAQRMITGVDCLFQCPSRKLCCRRGIHTEEIRPPARSQDQDVVGNDSTIQLD